MNILGIDPGKSGGLALLKDDGSIFTYGFTNKTGPDISQTLFDIKDEVDVCLLEKVHAMPGQGVTSMFTFGEGYGFLQGLLAAFKIRIERVPPQTWQKALGCKTGGDKNVTKRKAQELFPDVKITHQLADALLIAEYGRRTEDKVATNNKLQVFQQVNDLSLVFNKHSSVFQLKKEGRGHIELHNPIEIQGLKDFVATLKFKKPWE